MITKDGRDTPIEKLTPDNYVVPRGEEKDYHAVIEVEQFDVKTGKKLSKPRVQKFGRKTFENHVQASLRKQGYKVTILHDPNEWLKEQRAKAAENAKAKAEAEKTKFDAAVDAAVAKVTADLEKKYAEREKEIGRLLQELAQRKEAEAEAERKAEQEALLAAGNKKPGPGRPPKDQKEAPEQGSQSK